MPGDTTTAGGDAAADQIDAPAKIATPAPPAPVAPKAAPEAPATARWSAPDDVTAITTSTGRILAVADGFIDAPADLTDGERSGLVTAGFRPA